MTRHSALLLPILALLAGLAPLTARAITPEEVAKLQGPDRQKTLEAEARKEGEVTLYHTLIEDQVGRPTVEAFNKVYPWIKVNSVRSNTSEVLQRVMAETRARSVRVDVMVVDNVDAAQKSGAVLPFISPVMAEYPANYIDPGKTWVSLRVSWQGIGWNTRLVSAADAPHSWEALLDPKFKSKMAWTTSPDTGAPRLIMHLTKLWGEQKTTDYLTKLKAQDIRTVAGSVRTALDQVIAGEFSVGVSMSMHHIAISKSQGAPVDGDSPEPVLAKSNIVSYIKNAPHPAAGMLLVDFFLSKDGHQKILRESQYPPGNPALEPLPAMAWIVPSRNGKKELLLSPDEEDKYLAPAMELYKNIFR